MFLSRVWVPLSVPLSNANVGTTLCHSFFGVVPSKSSENSSSFFLARDLSGTADGSAAFAATATSKTAVARENSFMGWLRNEKRVAGATPGLDEVANGRREPAGQSRAAHDRIPS